MAMSSTLCMVLGCFSYVLGTFGAMPVNGTVESTSIQSLRLSITDLQLSLSWRDSVNESKSEVVVETCFNLDDCEDEEEWWPYACDVINGVDDRKKCHPALSSSFCGYVRAKALHKEDGSHCSCKSCACTLLKEWEEFCIDERSQFTAPILTVVSTSPHSVILNVQLKNPDVLVHYEEITFTVDTKEQTESWFDNNGDVKRTHLNVSIRSHKSKLPQNTSSKEGDIFMVEIDGLSANKMHQIRGCYTPKHAMFCSAYSYTEAMTDLESVDLIIIFSVVGVVFILTFIGLSSRYLFKKVKHYQKSIKKLPDSLLVPEMTEAKGGIEIVAKHPEREIAEPFIPGALTPKPSFNSSSNPCESNSKDTVSKLPEYIKEAGAHMSSCESRNNFNSPNTSCSGYYSSQNTDTSIVDQDVAITEEVGTCNYTEISGTLPIQDDSDAGKEVKQHETQISSEFSPYKTTSHFV